MTKYFQGKKMKPWRGTEYGNPDRDRCLCGGGGAPALDRAPRPSLSWLDGGEESKTSFSSGGRSLERAREKDINTVSVQYTNSYV